MTARTLIWWVIAATALADLLLLDSEGMTVSLQWRAVLGTLILLAVSAAYRRRSPIISTTALSATQLVMFSYAGAVLTYVTTAASASRPLSDDLLARADLALGFDWFAWFAFVNGHPWLKVPLALAYGSIPLQLMLLFGYMAFKDPRRANEFLLATMLSAILLAPIMAALPAVAHTISAIEPWRDDTLALRAHTLKQIGAVEGIVTFPSFHTTLAVLFTNTVRGRRWFRAVLILNALMIASVFSEGAHYFVDVLGGLALAVVAIAAARFLLARCQEESSPIKGLLDNAIPGSVGQSIG